MAEGAYSARDHRYLVHRMAEFVIGDDAAFFRGEQSVLLLRASDDPFHCVGETCNAVMGEFATR